MRPARAKCAFFLSVPLLSGSVFVLLLPFAPPSRQKLPNCRRDLQEARVLRQGVLCCPVAGGGQFELTENGLTAERRPLFLEEPEAVESLRWSAEPLPRRQGPLSPLAQRRPTEPKELGTPETPPARAQAAQRSAKLPPRDASLPAGPVSYTHLTLPTTPYV